jgi:hypothetical protein
VLRKQITVNRHEQWLAYGRAGLKLCKSSRSLLITQRTHSGANRTAGNQYNFATRLPLIRNLRDELLKLRGIGLLAAVGKHTRAKLDHEPGNVFQQFRTHAAKLKENRERESGKSGASLSRRQRRA